MINQEIGVRKGNFSVTFPKGKYYIGDICYCLNEDEYDNVWGKKYKYENGYYGYFAVGGTAYGDGTYYGGRWAFPVDAGVIGVVELSHAKEDKYYEELGRIVEVQNYLTFDYDSSGIFSFDIDGQIFEIDTVGYEDDEEDDY